MNTPLQFKSGEFYGKVHHGTRGSVFDIRRLYATRSEDEVETHRHDDAHFVLVLSGVYISSARHAPPRAPSPTLVFNPAGTTRRDRFLDGKGSFMTVPLAPVLMAGAEELHAAQERATVLGNAASTAAAAFGIAREISLKWQYQPKGTAMTGGGLQLRSADLAKLGQLYLDGGRWGGKQVIPAAWVRRSIQPQAHAREG